MKRYLVNAFVLVVIFSVFSASPLVAMDDDHEDHHDEEETIHLDEETLSEFGVILETAKSGQVMQKKLFPGEIRIHMDFLARVRPRFSGVVKKILVHLGDDVKKGDILAVIESNESLTSYKILSSISGTIIERNLTIGENVQANSKVFEIADLNTVWATFSIFQDKIGDIVKGQKASVRSRNGKHIANGIVSYISPTVDPQTRTQLGRIVLSNSDTKWRPGMFVGVDVLLASIKGNVVVPETAIQRIDNNPVIFVQEDGGIEPHSVQLGYADKDFVIVQAGLAPGDIYASDGGFILKAELEKGTMGHGHSH